MDTSDLWERVTSHEALQGAWFKVNANEGAAGGDGVTRAEFHRDLFANLTQLRAELLNGTYRSGPFRKVSIPKKKPGYRILTIPSLRDRIVHTAMASVLSAILEPLFNDGSFGYRPGRGVVDAVERIEQWRKRGYDVVIEADIVSYFDHIDQTLLRPKVAEILSPLPGQAPFMALLDIILADQARALGTPQQGLVQGSPLSPILANLHLDVLDDEIEEQGVKIVRYADDFVILCKSEKKAERVLEHCIAVLADQNLQLHAEGTRIVNFDRGFDFVGYLFLRSLALKGKQPAPQRQGNLVKSAVTDEGVIELEERGSRFDPGKRVLYVLDPDHHLSIRNRSFSVTREDGSELIAIPHRRIGRIEIGPGISFNRQPLDLALSSRIDLAVTDGFGQTRGTLTANTQKRAGLQFAQAQAILTPVLRSGIARKLICARLRNQRTQLMRLNRSQSSQKVDGALDSLKRLLAKLETVSSIDELLGMEGAASAGYWPALGALCKVLKTHPFRRTRPAQDPLNAVLNYLTGILERDIRAAIHDVGLHPGFGFLHVSRDRHDGLVYDLMEPFRAPLTEGLAVYLFNSKRVKPDLFDTQAAETVLMSGSVRKALIRGYETAVAKRIQKPDQPGKLTWRAMMRYQSQSLAHALNHADSSRFHPLVMDS